MLSWSDVGIRVDPIGNVYSMLYVPPEELSKLIPSVPPGYIAPPAKVSSVAFCPSGSTKAAPKIGANYKAPLVITAKHKAPPVVPPKHKAPPESLMVPGAMPVTLSPDNGSDLSKVREVRKSEDGRHTLEHLNAEESYGCRGGLPPVVVERTRSSLLMQERVVLVM